MQPPADITSQSAASSSHAHTQRQPTQAAACMFVARACCLRQLRQRASKPPSIHTLLGQKQSKAAAAAGTRACVVGGHQSDVLLLAQQQHTQFKLGSRDRCCSRASPGMPVAAYAHTSVAPCGGLFSHTLSRRACQTLPLLLPSSYSFRPCLRQPTKAPHWHTQQLPQCAASKHNMPAGVLRATFRHKSRALCELLQLYAAGWR